MTALVADPLCKQHDPGPGHPEQMRRFDAVLSALTAAGHVGKMLRFEPRDPTRDDLLLAHEAALPGACGSGDPPRPRDAQHGRYRHLRANMGCSAEGRRQWLCGGRCHLRWESAARVLSRAPSGPSRFRRAGHGLLRAQQHRPRGAPCAAPARRRARAHRRLGRASRQRYAGHLLRRRYGLLFQHASASVVSRHGARP